MTAIPGAKTNSNRGVFYYWRGRVALCAILRALELKSDDEVLLQAFTCLAVLSPIVGLGLKPVYVDIDPNTYNINPELLEKRITPRSRVIIVQHTFGIPAPMAAILALAQKHGLVVIEDCCHVLGSRYEGKDLGTFGDAAFYSYEWGKPIVIGVGGAAIIHSSSVLESVRSRYEQYLRAKMSDVAKVNVLYAAHSLLRRPALFWAVRGAYRLLSRSNFMVSSFREEEFEGKLNQEYEMRMPDILRRRLSTKSRGSRVMKSVHHRARLGREYEMFMRGLGLDIVDPPSGSETVFLRFPLIARDKDKVLEKARAAHIEMGDWFASPVHPLTPAQWPTVMYNKGSCPVAEHLSSSVVTLPVSDRVGTRDSRKALDFITKIADADLLKRRLTDRKPAA